MKDAVTRIKYGIHNSGHNEPSPIQNFRQLSSRKHCNGSNRVIWNSSRGTCKFSASGPTMLKGSHELRNCSVRCCCLGTLVDLDGVTPSNWVSIVDQVLLVTSVVFTSIAGIVPTESSLSRKNDLGHDAFLENSTSFGSSIKNDPQFTSKTFWNAVKRKLLGALSAIEHDGTLENRVVECEKHSAKLPLNLYNSAISEGPRLRLLWATSLICDPNSMGSLYMSLLYGLWILEL